MLDLHAFSTLLASPAVSAIIAAFSGIMGAYIGSSGAIKSQGRAQVMIAARELDQQARREERVAAAFRGMVLSIQAFMIGPAKGTVYVGDEAALAIVVAPFQRALQEPTFYLGLTPAQLGAVFGLLTRVETLNLPLRKFDDCIADGGDEDKVQRLGAGIADLALDIFQACNETHVELGGAALSLE